MRSSTDTLIKALRILSMHIDTEDGVINAALAEAADRLEELHISRPIVTVKRTGSFDTRESWIVELNGLNMGVYEDEENAKNRAASIEKALGIQEFPNT